MTSMSEQIGASIGTALLDTIAAAATTAYLASHASPRIGVAAAKATVHGYARASWWVRGIFLLTALVAALLLNVHPGQPTATKVFRKSTTHDVLDTVTASGIGTGSRWSSPAIR